MADLLRQIINMSLTAGAVILVVLLARALLRRAPRWCSYALWSVVLFRLLCPVSISSALSMLNLARAPVSTGSGRITMVDYAGVIQQSAQTAQQPADLPVAAGSGAVQSAPAGPGWQEVLAWVWVCAAAAMLLWALVSYLSLRVRLWDSQHFEGRVYVSKRIGTAFVSGLIRPKIYLPENLSGRERECVLAHERCHIRRGDHLIKPLAYIALCLHWFNPLVWLAWVLAMRDMEASCDEAAIKRLGGASRADYAQTLLNLAAGRGVSLAVSLSFGSDTKHRIKEVAKMKPNKRWISTAAAALCVLIIAGCAANPAPTATPAATPSGEPVQADTTASGSESTPLYSDIDAAVIAYGFSRLPYTPSGVSGASFVSSFGGIINGAELETWTYLVVNSAGTEQRCVFTVNRDGSRDIVYEGTADEVTALYGPLHLAAEQWWESNGFTYEKDLPEVWWTVAGSSDLPLSIHASRQDFGPWSAHIPDSGWNLSTDDETCWRLDSVDGSGATYEIKFMSDADYDEWLSSFGNSRPVNSGLYRTEQGWQLQFWQGREGFGIVQSLSWPECADAQGEVLLKIYRSVYMK